MGAHVIMLSNSALTRFIDAMLTACTSPSSEVHQRERPPHENSTHNVFPQRRHWHIRMLKVG